MGHMKEVRTDVVSWSCTQDGFVELVELAEVHGGHGCRCSQELQESW